MTNEAYRPTDYNAALARVAEECAEVIKVVAKAQRFGINDIHPVKGKRNIDLLLEEVQDVITARDDLLTIMHAMLPAGWQAALNAHVEGESS